MQKVIKAGETIGIFGGGQLAKMLCQAASRLGYKTCVYTDVPGCACSVATEKIIAPYDDDAAIRDFVDRTAVTTVEFENIPLATIDRALEHSHGKKDFFPGRRAFEVAQDRRNEKKTARELRIKTPDFWVIEHDADLQKPSQFPLVLKTAREGYDGKGQIVVGSSQELRDGWGKLERVPCVAEERIDFAYELSVIVARTESGEAKCYTPFKNTHRDGILRETIWPAEDISAKATGNAGDIALTLALNLNVVGLLAVEMFCTMSGDIIFNEIAPRPHNSGHVMIECAMTSQFEQHIRAICGLPLGSVDPICSGRMVNVIGTHSLITEELHYSKARIHLYGKEERPGRKLGHITFIAR